MFITRIILKFEGRVFETACLDRPNISGDNISFCLFILRCETTIGNYLLHLSLEQELFLP